VVRERGFHGPKDYLDLARSPEATIAELRQLARSPYEFVVQAVAEHTATPADVLATLVPPDLTTWNRATILAALVRNPNTPSSSLRDVPELVLSRLHDRDAHQPFHVGVALAERTDTPDELLIDMVSDPRATTEFRKVVARHTTHPSLRDYLRSDRSDRVRRAANREQAEGDDTGT
jgi:hypothetical protein